MPVAGAPPTPAEAAAPVQPAANQEAWRVVAAIDPDCVLPAARALQIVLAAGLIGTVVESRPSLAEIEATNVEKGAQILLKLVPNDPATAATSLRDALGRILEVTIVSVTSSDGTSAETPIPAVAAGGTANQIWQVEADIDSRCMLPSVRALQIVLACGVVGSVVTSQPEMATIEAGKVENSAHVTVQVATAAPDAGTQLASVLDRIFEVTVARIISPGGAITTPFAGETAKPPKFRSLSAEKADAVKVDADELESVVAQLPKDAPAMSNPAPTSASAARNADHPENEINRGATNANVAPTAHAPRMVRIDVERLDALMNLVGELVIDRTRLARITTRVGAHTDDQNLVEELTETCRHLARISDDLQDEVMRSRMLPIESVFSKFPRLVRDLAQRVNKKIDFIVEGKDTELDRSVAEQIGDPIIHLLRNSIDHGIEPEDVRRAAGKPESGQIRLSARHEENQIVIDVEDDGKGISAEFLRNKAVSRGIISPEAAQRMGDREALELIFASGFSTAEQVSDISGRGVGMDIVRTNVERLNGSITLETEEGQGTRFTVRLPLTLAIIRALLVNVAGQTYAIPLSSVVEALRIEQSELRAVNGCEAMELRGQVLPLLRLSQIFRSLSPDQQEHFAAPTGEADATISSRHFVVAVRWGDRRGGLIVDSLIGEQEIVIKSLGQLFRSAHGISGGAVLGDGQVAPILDIAALIKHIIAEERNVALVASGSSK